MLGYAIEPDHGKVFHGAIEAFLAEKGIDRKTAKFVAAVMLPIMVGLTLPMIADTCRGGISETDSRIEWDAERLQMLERYGIASQNVMLLWTYPRLQRRFGGSPG